MDTAAGFAGRFQEHLDALTLQPHVAGTDACSWPGCLLAPTPGQWIWNTIAYGFCPAHDALLRVELHHIAQRATSDARLTGEDLCDAEGFLLQQRLPDRRRVAIAPQTFRHAQLGIGMSPPFTEIGVFADSWDFLSIERAVYALLTWNPDTQTEPDGWHRYAASGRYRILGQPNLEYIKAPDGLPFHQQLEHALQVTCGRDRLLKDVAEEPLIQARWFPEGCQCFLLSSESTTCEHTPRCQWADGVFHYLDRFVVVPVQQMMQDGGIKVTEIGRRLTGKLLESEETWKARLMS